MGTNITEGIIGTEATGQTSNQQAQTNPWEMAWNDAKSFVADKVEQVKTNLSQGVMPWEKDWSAPKQTQMPTSTQAPAPKSDQFETVFNNMIQAESKGQHTDASGSLIRSSVGAEGITQLMPATAQDPGYGIEGVKDQSKGEYMRVGRAYLKAMLKEFDGDYEKALAAYNAGVGNVKKAVSKAEQKGGEWINYLPKKSETIPYIKRILGNG